jgi:hypothetical protein
MTATWSASMINSSSNCQTVARARSAVPSSRYAIATTVAIDTPPRPLWPTVAVSDSGGSGLEPQA